jgi:alpha-L-rhamnosidase
VDGAYYHEISERARKAYLWYAERNGLFTGKRQSPYVRAINFELADEKDRPALAAALNNLLCQNGYKLNTGFLATPYLCEILCRYGYEDTAFRILFNEEKPGWLYEALHGCTTVTEVWDCFDENGAPSESFNHFAFGTIARWIITYAVGIRIDTIKKRVNIQPHPYKGKLDAVNVAAQTPLGTINVEWDATDGGFKIKADIPPNVEAAIMLPDGQRFEVTGGHFESDKEVSHGAL